MSLTLKKYLKFDGKPFSYAEFRKKIQSFESEDAKALEKSLLGPLLKQLDDGKPLNSSQVKISDIDLPVGSNVYTFKLPEVFGTNIKCLRNNKSSSVQIDCVSISTGAQLSVSIVQESKGELRKLNGKELTQAKSLPIVEDLKRSGDWSKIESKLTADQRKYLSSVPGKWSCKEEKSSARFFWNNAYACSGNIYNYGDVGFSSYWYASQSNVNNHLILAQITVPTASLAHFYFPIATIIVGSAKIAK